MAEPSAALALVADIGATNARFALIAPGGHEIVAPLIMRCADFPGLAEAAQAYLRKSEPRDRPSLAAFDVAGPVTGDVVQLTNHPWRIEISAVRRDLGLDRLEVINDFAALAHAVPRLGPADRVVIRNAATVAAGPIAVVGPGTGLGVAAVIPDGAGGWVPLASEGGHVTLAAADEREDAILAELRRRFGHVSAERVLSGPGLVYLYEAVCALAKKSPQPLTPEQVAERARAGEKLPAETLGLFFAWLGNVAGNLALTVGATGGVAIAGGIVPRYLSSLADSKFEERFLDKGRLRSYLEPIPVYVVTHPLPAFIGLAGLLAEVEAAPAARRLTGVAM
jgi:glucokinase